MTRYVLGEPYFTSGRSTFFRATNPILGNEVVVRRLEVDPERAEDQRATFLREQRHMAALRHPHIQKTLDIYEEDGAHWSVHPFIPSVPADQKIDEMGPFALGDAARIAGHAADAISYLHDRGFVHGRIEPGFILVAEHGETILTNLVKSADLAAGLWPLREAVRGIGPFTSPEERRGERPGEASDVFGLAVTFLGLIGATEDRIDALVRTCCDSGHGEAALHSLADVIPPLPRGLADALARALHPDPAQRRGSAASLAALFSDLHALYAAEVPSGFTTGTLLAASGLEGPIELTGRLGAGAFGVVLRARHAAHGNTLAVKVLKAEHRADHVVVERFLREARALRRIRHENVVRVHGVGESLDVPFLVMDFIDGPTLSTHIRRRGFLPAAEAAAVALGIARGLGAIHDASLLHRDLKPDNVMLYEGRCPVVTDLGVAKALRDETRITMTGMVVGTPHYMAPEQAWSGAVDRTSDLYALGTILYECLTGSPPYSADDLMSLLFAIKDQEPRPLPGDVPAPLASLVSRLLRKDPRERPQTAEEVAEELVGFAVPME